MEGGVVRFVAEGTTFDVRREQLLPELEEGQKRALQERVVLPGWVSSAIFSLLQEYLGSGSLSVYRECAGDAALLIQTLRLADYLGLFRFQERFITEVVTPCISTANCVVFLEETHRKLKNQENGSQCWYSLLNASITFLACNLKDVYRTAADKLKRLHEKILNEVLDRAIRNGTADEQMIFELILESRKVTSVEALCQTLRAAIENKKINPKIHAKLSWKLQDVAHITDKRTKNFKFLDLDWLLEATRSRNDDLNVKLTYTGNGKCELGAFYVKERREERIRLSYVLMNRREELGILTLTPQMQRELERSKVELSIFCCLDQIYTFSLNFLARNHEKVDVDERKLTPEELAIIVLLLKERKQYSSCIRFMKFLACAKGELPQEYLADFPLSQLTPYEIDFIQKMSVQKVVQVDLASLPAEPSDIKSIPNQSRRSEERPESRGRLRKIFASSPSRSLANESTAPVRLQDINRIADLRNYFYDKGSPLCSQL